MRDRFETVHHLAEQEPDWGGVLAEILNVLRRVTTAQVLLEAINGNQGDRERVLALAWALPAEDVQFYYQVSLIGRRDLPLVPDPRSGFEMVLLRMPAFHLADADGAPRTSLKDLGISKATTGPVNSPVAGAASPASVAAVAATPIVAAPVEAPAVPPAALSAPPAAVEARVAEAVVEEPAAVVEVVDLSQEGPAPSLAAKPEPEPGPEPGPEPEPKPEPLTVEAPSVPSAVAIEVVMETALEALPVALPVAPDEQDEQDDKPPPMDDHYGVDMNTPACLDAVPEPGMVVVEEPLPVTKPATDLVAEWLGLFPRLGLGDLTVSIVANRTLVAADGDHWHLHLDPGQSAPFNTIQQRRLNGVLNQRLGYTLKLEAALQEPEQGASAWATAHRRAKRRQAAEASIDADPSVRQLREQFAAAVRDGTTEPLEAKA